MEIAKTKVQRYEKYKDSGVTWLGDIPEHWKVESFKNILTERNEKNQPIRTKEILSLSIDKGVTLYAEKTTNLDRFKDDFSQYKLAYKGDLVLNSMNMIVGAVGVSDYFGCVSPVYYTYHGGLDNSYTSKFYEYLFRCKTVQGVLYSLGKGLIAIDRGEGKYNTLRLKVSRDDLRSLRLPFPHLSERTAIVTYLDRKTALINQAIDIKQKQIELLKERRQILIHKAVTRGLNPNVKLKDSGIEWIGEIPEGWHLKTLKFLKANIKNAFVDGPFGSNLKSEHFIEDGNVYVVESGFITTGVFINKVFKTISEKHYQTIKRSTCNEGDVIIAKIGANYGMAAELPLLDKKAVVSGNSLKITLDNSKVLNILFVKLLGLSKTLGGFEEIVNASAQPALSLGGLNNLKLPIAPIDEQPLIAKHIDYIESKIATAISLKEQEIEKLKEYKATLINSAVTGKIKVC